MNTLHSIISGKFLVRVVAVLTLLGLSGIVFAQEDEEADKGKRFVVESKWVYTRLNEAQEFMEKKQYAKAMESMNEMKGRSRLSDYEKSLMWQTIAYIHHSRGKTKLALKAFEKCLKINYMPKNSLLTLEYNMGQLYLTIGQYKKAIRTFKSWFAKAKNPGADAKYMMAMAYVQTKDYKNALGWAKQAVEQAPKPRENYYAILLSINFELKKKKEVARVLEKLVNNFPKKNYFLQLSAIYSELKKELRSLAVLELAYMQGYLRDSSELNNLVQLLLYNGVPIKGARVLKKGMDDGIVKSNEKSLTSLGDAYLRARELDKAIGPLTAAAKLSSTGDIFIRLAHIYLEKEKWPKAVGALSSALRKGKLRDTGNAHLLLGISYYSQKKFTQALKSFQNSRKYPNTKKRSDQWIRMIKTRQNR